MKFAAIALASALAAAAFALPSFAQQNQSDQPNQNQYGQGGQNQFQNGREDWRQGRNERDDDDSGGGWRRMHRFGMGGGMQGMMDRMERHHRFANENEGAHFRLRRGQAMIDVKCPENESMQACVNAATQLLDKVAGMRNGNTAAGTTNGTGLGSGATIPQGGSLTPGSSTPGGASGKLGQQPQ
jgi:hypothetical protein